MKIFLTGSTGFIGREVINQYPNTRCVVRSSNTDELVDKFNVKCINKDTCWYGAFNGVDVIIHLAGLAHVHDGFYTETEYEDINVNGTLNLAKQATNAGVKRFVFVSSIGVNGRFTINNPFTMTGANCPHNSYTRSKYNAEIGLKKIASETGLEVVVVRPTLVYGPNAPGNFGLLTNLVNKLPLLPFALVNNKRDFIAVQNLADLLITCATHPNAAGHTFLASDMETVSIKQFTNAIAEGLGKNVLQLPIPVSLMRLAGKLMGKSAMMEQLVGNLQVDSSNLKEVLDWTPPLTMKQAMASLRDSGKSS